MTNRGGKSEVKQQIDITTETGVIDCTYVKLGNNGVVQMTLLVLSQALLCVPIYMNLI